jgi:hypothetical protein
VAAYPIIWEPAVPVKCFSAPAVSVSMPVVLRAAEMLRIDTAFGGSLQAADIGTVLVECLVDYEVSLELRILRSFTSRKLTSWAFDSGEDFVQ